MLSDITDASRFKLCTYTHRGERYPQRKTKLHWPNQVKISMKYWRLWTRTISNLFTHDDNNLYTPLKNWHTTGIESQHWISYRDTNTNHLHLQPTQQGQKWMRHKSASKRNLVYNTQDGIPCNPPARAVRISLQLEIPSTWIYLDSTTALQSKR